MRGSISACTRPSVPRARHVIFYNSDFSFTSFRGTYLFGNSVPGTVIERDNIFPACISKDERHCKSIMQKYETSSNELHRYIKNIASILENVIYRLINRYFSEHMERTVLNGFEVSKILTYD